MKSDIVFLARARGVFAGLSILVTIAATQVASAWTYSLSDGNASTTIQADGPYGMTDLTVDGQTQLYRQSFFYRSGGSGPEHPISDLTLSSANLLAPNALSTVYHSGSAFSIGITYVLHGGAIGSSSASVGEQITINNLTSNPLSFHFFQYVDFDLGGDWLGDTLTLEQNAQGLFERAYQTKGNFYFADEIVSPAANHGEVGLSQSTLIKLTDSFPTTLSDNIGPVTGDAVWAFQWDVVIPANQSFDIAINKSVYVVPEPSTIGILSVSLIALGFARRRLASN